MTGSHLCVFVAVTPIEMEKTQFLTNLTDIPHYNDGLMWFDMALTGFVWDTLW